MANVEALSAAPKCCALQDVRKRAKGPRVLHAHADMPQLLGGGWMRYTSCMRLSFHLTHLGPIIIIVIIMVQLKKG